MGTKCTCSNHHSMHHGFPHYHSSHWKALQGIDWFRSSNFTSLLFNLSTHWRQFQDPHTTHNSKIEHCWWFTYDNLRYDSFASKDSTFQIYQQLCDLQQATRYRNYFWHRHSEEDFTFMCLGQRKELLYTKGW